MRDSNLPNAIEGNKKDTYNNAVLDILKFKDVISRLLKVSVSEYSDLDLPSIASLLTFNGEKVETLDGDFGNCKCDIVLKAKLPKSKEKESDCDIYINIEAQNVVSLNERLPHRAFCYITQLTAAQYKTEEYKPMEYEKLKKVYSIWLCPNSSYDHIERAGVVVKEGNSIFKDEAYDFMEIVNLYRNNLVKIIKINEDR